MKFTDVFFGTPWKTGAMFARDWFDIVAGSRENKSKALLDLYGIPGSVMHYKQYETFSTKYVATINEQKKTPENKKYWEKTVLFNTDIETPKIPSIPDIAKNLQKYLIYIGAAIIAVYLLGKYIGRK